MINLQSSAELAGAQQEDHGKTAIDIDELPSIQRQIEELLVCGEREEALKLAIDSSEWALAMLIGCVCGQKEYQEVVRKFAAQSLPVDSPLHMISMMYSNQARGSILADSLLSQSISHNALISVVKEPNNASEASSLSVRTQRLQLSKSRIESADYEKSDEPTTSVWQEKLIALLANKGSDWKELFASFGYRTQLKSDLGNLAASHFVYLCGGIYPSNPVSKSAAIGDATTQGEAISRLRKKYIGNYTLLGCDISSSRHKSVADCVSVLGLRLTEILEWILSRRLLMLESTSQSSATNSSISKSLTGLFGWGDSSQSSFSSTKTVAETNQAELHSLKEELVRVRIVLAPLKIRFAFTLLDFGLFDSALKYVVEVRQLIADVASQAVSAASKIILHLQSQIVLAFIVCLLGKNGSAARSVNVSKRPGDKAGAAKIPTKAFNEHFTRAVDELYDRLKGGASTAVLSNPTNSMHSTSNSEIPPRQSNGTNETTPSASQTQYPSTASGSAWGLAISSTVMSALSTTNLKDFVDGNAVDAHHGASRTAQVSNPSASYAYGASAVNTTPACGGAMSNNTTGDLHQQSSGAWFIGSTSPPESTGSSMPPSMYNQQSQGTGSFEGGGFSSSGFFATNELKDSLSMGYSQSQAIQQGPDGGRQHTDSATTVRVEEKHKDTKSTNSSSAPASSGGLVKSVRKGLLNWLYPDAVDTSENMGNSLEAYFDKATGKWVFPGEVIICLLLKTLVAPLLRYHC